MKALMAKKKNFPGGKQYVVDQLRYRYQSNFQWFNGASVVSYNKRVTIEQAQFPRAWPTTASRSTRIAWQNGIVTTITARAATLPSPEQVQLTSLLEEQTETLRLGFEEKFSMYLQLDGTSSSDAIAGLDLIVSLDPSNDTVGGIASASNTYWRNKQPTGLTAVTTQATAVAFLAAMEKRCGAVA